MISTKYIILISSIPDRPLHHNIPLSALHHHSKETSSQNNSLYSYDLKTNHIVIDPKYWVIMKTASIHFTNKYGIENQTVGV